MWRSSIGSVKTEWLGLLEAQAITHDTAMVRPDTAEYDFLLVRGRAHGGGIFETIASIAHASEEIPDDTFALGVVRVSDAVHREALVEMPGPPVHQYFFADIHGPLILLQKHADLRVYLVVLDVYGKEGFDPKSDHMTVLPGDTLTDVSKKRGPYLEVAVHGRGRYASPADEYVDDWSILFEGADSPHESARDEN